MFTRYFEDLEKGLLAKIKTSKTDKSAKEAPAGKGTAVKKAVPKGGKAPVKGDMSAAAPGTVKFNDLRKTLQGMIPDFLKLDSVKVVDSTDYSPEGIDFLVYREMYPEIMTMLGGRLPAELVYGTYHAVVNLTEETLLDALKRVMQAKKLNRYVTEKNEEFVIPAFILVYATKLPLAKIKEIVLEQYMANGTDHAFEFDILMVLNRGLLIKDWREKRNFVGLETGPNTLKWFFILMNEYFESDRGKILDLRSYARETGKYNEC